MSDDARIEHLLDELANSHAKPEEVCANCPELLSEVRDRWQQMRRLGADLDALFPPAETTGPYSPEEPTLPQVPGYVVEEMLGRGGMGIVFRARHLRLNRLVALKMSRACGTRTSCASTTWATTTAGPSSRWSTSRGGVSPTS